LRNTTIELAKARETIHELHAKTAQLGEIKSRLGYLEETLARETSAVRAAISELPFDSKPRLDLEGLLESLLTSPAADDGSVRDDAETLSYLPPVPGEDLGALAISEADVDIWIDRLVSAVESTDAAEDDEPSPATNGHAVNGTAHHTDANGLATS
ncbi:hypothetical protein GGH92_010961, partial [Coemansia sp. RSA 2673]